MKVLSKMKSFKVENNLALRQGMNNQENAEIELERLRIWSKNAAEQVKQLEADKAGLQNQVDEYKNETNRRTLLGRWRSNANVVEKEDLEKRYSMLFKEKLEMEEDLTAMIKDRDEKIAMMRKEHQQLQRKTDTNMESISKSSKKKLEKVAKATEQLREEVDYSMEKISKMTNVVDNSVERLEEILDGLDQREDCDEEDAMALALGESLSLLQQHVKVSLHLLEQKVNNRLDSTINDGSDHGIVQSNPFESNDLLTDIRIEVMDLIRKADFELSEKILYMQEQIEELKEC